MCQLYNLKLFRACVRRIEKSADIKVDQEDAICESLKCLFERFHEAETRDKLPNDVLFDSFGFNLEKRASSIKGAGNGVFVSKGVIPKDAIAAMYPGSQFFIVISYFISMFIS